MFGLFFFNHTKYILNVECGIELTFSSSIDQELDVHNS